MNLKPAIPISEQIEKLRVRGLLIDDPEAASSFMASYQYYRLNIYFHKFMNNDNHFKPGTRFSDIVNVYNHDYWFRHTLFLAIEPIEVVTRSRIAYHLAMKYGPACYYKSQIFKNLESYNRSQEQLDHTVTKLCKDPVVLHHKNYYDGKLPIWVIVELLSFNSLSVLFSNLVTENKKTISSNAFNMNEDYLQNWLHSLCVLRNICAHYGYLYKRKFSIPPRISKELNWHPEKNSELFAQFLVIIRLSAREIRERIIISLQDRVTNFHHFNLRDYGFPDDWQDRVQKIKLIS